MSTVSAGRVQKRTVVDGPFAETKEYVAGFGSVEAESKPYSIEVTKPFLAVGGEGDSDRFVTLSSQIRISQELNGTFTTPVSRNK